MKKKLLKWAFIVMLCGFSSCGSNDEPNANQPNKVDESKILASIDYSEMVFVDAGTFFWMGAQSTDGSLPNYDIDAREDESPVHEVVLDDFYIGKYEVTQQLWEYVMTYNGIAADGTSMRSYASDPWLGMKPSFDSGMGNDYPANNSYYNIVEIFLPRLNKITGKQFRLPTEAEWENAARGGNKSKGYKFSGSNNIRDVAWYNDNSSRMFHQVGKKAPNELGLYDMSGNAEEWCYDWYKDCYYSYSQTNPTGPQTGYRRVTRGGSAFYEFEGGCRVSYRYRKYPEASSGFRLAHSAK